MPEGDALFRTAATLRRWLGGYEITAARAPRGDIPAAQLVGLTVDTVEANGKHLLIRFVDGPVLHSHMRMTGSWHVYRPDDRWQRPARQARLVLEAGNHIAVCFNAPVIELLAAEAERVHPALRRLGPDLLGDAVDVQEIVRRARTRPPERALGELLLDQTVAAGIGNIWRSESLFLEGLHPWTPQSAIDDLALGGLFRRAATLLRASADGRPPPHWVYRRAGRRCRRCNTGTIASRRQGGQARVAYWCPTCQPARGA